ncbi:MAG: hypothetical protein JWL81_3379 [Verrucomicrobiales bacterium]|nr:hypothetical protein [Verrucomicrobiales bacterium]
MSDGSPGQWFPFYQPAASFADFRYPSFAVDLRPLPLVPPAMPISAPSLGLPRARWLWAHTSLQIAADGRVLARWASAENNVMVETVLTLNELNLLNPDASADNQSRPTFGIGINQQAATPVLPPLSISYSVAQLPQGQTLPANPAALAGKDLFIRQGLIAFGPEIRAACWPEYSVSPPSPPPTLNDRSFYRIKSLPALHDANNNDFPDELEGYFSDLLISEACYASLAPVNAHQPHEFLPVGEDYYAVPAFLGRPPDWVEILKPTDHAISTAGYYFSDSLSNLKRFAFPDLSIPPYATLILLLSDSPHPLFATEGDPASLLRKCWVNFRLKDEGETVYLSKNTPTAGNPAAYSIVDTLETPTGNVTALTGFTVGKVPRADHTWATVYLPGGSPDKVNQGWGLNRFLTAPVISEVPAAGGAAAPAHSRLFRRASDLPRINLSHPDPTVTITYTLDGSEPGPEDGIYEGPLEILNTTVLRARAFAGNAVPSPTATRTYISSEGVLSQLAPPTLPLQIPSVDTLHRFDPAMAAAYGHNRPPQRAGYPASGTPANPGTKTIIEQLEARPAVFITLDPQGQSYNSPGGSSDPETPAAFEWVDPARPADYRQENAMVQLTGGNASSTSEKKSLDVIFKGATTFTGKSEWQGPVLGDGTSALFPGSPVTVFPRLLLRNPMQASFLNPHGPTDKVYISDAWMKETQRALGGNAPFTTVQRRWVHVFINGYYWGVYDMEEHFDADTISAHLIAALPANTSAAVKALYKPSLILTGQPAGVEPYTPASVAAQWWFNTVKAKAAEVHDATPETRAAKFAELETVVDLDAYIDYITTLQIVSHGELSYDNVRAWRHPVTQKWYIMAWDGDVLSWYDGSFINDPIYNSQDRGDQLVHRALKLIPEYAVKFGSRLQLQLAGPASFAGMRDRFNALSEDFRQTLECEALRWGRYSVDGSNRIVRWETDISERKVLLFNPHPMADETSLYNNLIRSAQAPGYLPSNFPLLSPP